MKAFFQVHHGKRYKDTKTLIMSESTYDWKDKRGQWNKPKQDLPKWSVEDGYGSKKPAYIQAMSRALCNKISPTEAEKKKAWERFSYWVYVQQSVGKTWLKRPTNVHWNEAKGTFLDMLEEERPERVIVTGLQMWERMPDAVVMLHKDLQAFQLKDSKTLVWCLAIPHPSARKPRFYWKVVSLQIEAFVQTKFPRDVSSMKYRIGEN